MSYIPMVKLHDGRLLPQVGLGVWQIPDNKLDTVIPTAINNGYRLIDTAFIYENEAGVGRGIKLSEINRENLYVTTKLWNTEHSHENATAAFKSSLATLNLDYIDLYLIHWPVPKINQYVEAWESLIRLRDEGLIRSIGVCNFNIEHIQKLLDKTGVLPAVNQIELHPGFQQPELRQFHADQGIQTQAWSPLGQGTLWNNSTLIALAKKHNKSVAQIILRWHIQLGNMIIPKSISSERQQQNLQIFDFVLDESDMERIKAIHKPDGRIGPDPELFRLPKS